MTVTQEPDEEIEAEVRALPAIRETSTQLATWMPRFNVPVEEMVKVVEEKQRFMTQIMKEGHHYGVIPGTKRKVLLKPGAELLLASMGLHPVYSNSSPPVLDFTGSEHGGEPFIMYERTCSIYRQTGPGEHDRMLVATGEGSCNSWEMKYRWRNEDRTCPDCGKATIRVSNFDDSRGDFYCNRKAGGCGHKFKKGTAQHTALNAVVIGRVPNPDVAELANTILKMASKRALTDATLLATGFSQDFTQDVEVEGGEEYDGGGSAPDASWDQAAPPVDDFTQPPPPDDMDPNGPGPQPPAATEAARMAVTAPETGQRPSEPASPQEAATAKPAASAAAPSAADSRQQKVDTLMHLADDLPPSAMFNRIKVKALLGKTGETPESVRDALYEAHRKAHDGDCTHIQVATQVWPA